MGRSTPFSAAPDWGVVGHYEDVTAGSLPDAQTTIEKAPSKGGERVTDVGTRKGNSAILAARAGGDG